MKPFIKWAGGKAQLAPTLVEYFPQKIENYCEPFLGGGAIFFYLMNMGFISSSSDNEVILNDLNRKLMETWGQIKGDPERLVHELRNYEQTHEMSPEFFYSKNRMDFNNQFTLPSLTAPLFIYLNKAGFNGLYRENSKGKFNVPFGKKNKVNLFDYDNIMDIHKALQNVSLLNEDYKNIHLSGNPSSWFIYFDPPYVPLNPTSSFTSYTAEGFNIKEQEELAKNFEMLDHQGCKLALSNSDTQLVRDLYSGFKIHEVEASRRINCKGEKRGKITELLVTNY